MSALRHGSLEKNCEACFALITVRVADHKRGWGRFCDKACAAAHKVGMRPRDVNAHHAKKSPWARACMDARKAAGVETWPAAPRLKDQIGKVKVRPLYHSPASCQSCGEPINGPGLCDDCETHEQGLWANEAGWDGHKGMFG